jgi:hypothetical protein
VLRPEIDRVGDDAEDPHGRQKDRHTAEGLVLSSHLCKIIPHIICLRSWYGIISLIT